MQAMLNADTEQPLISYYDYLVNDKTNTCDCQYNMYWNTLTMTQKNRDRSVAQDTRQAAVTIKIQLQVPDKLPATHSNGGIHWQALYIDHERIAYLLFVLT